MTRTVIALAVATGVAPSEWAKLDERGIATAVQILDDQEKQMNNKSPEPGYGSDSSSPPQYSG